MQCFVYNLEGQLCMKEDNGYIFIIMKPLNKFLLVKTIDFYNDICFLWFNALGMLWQSSMIWKKKPTKVLKFLLLLLLSLLLLLLLYILLQVLLVYTFFMQCFCFKFGRSSMYHGEQ